MTKKNFIGLEIKGNLLNIINDTKEKSTSNTIPNGEKQLFSPKIRKKNRMPVFTTAIQQCTGSSTQRN